MAENGILTEEEALFFGGNRLRLQRQSPKPKRAFRKLKDVFEVRPIVPHDFQRAQLHAFVATLAFLLGLAPGENAQGGQAALFDRASLGLPTNDSCCRSRRRKYKAPKE
ncbi:hypothetical protein [Methylacidimicrobium cyclopophantes]|uniref:hypothetical protein n=1 Tax=Methylacidimicrobium cyclopophantes TaxID=1041766 RepID=UPI00115781DB|nr:hypothetical protein [Methylacidimicrobium cyclopophantes]